MQPLASGWETEGEGEGGEREKDAVSQIWKEVWKLKIHQKVLEMRERNHQNRFWDRNCSGFWSRCHHLTLHFFIILNNVFWCVCSIPRLASCLVALHYTLWSVMVAQQKKSSNKKTKNITGFEWLYDWMSIFALMYICKNLLICVTFNGSVWSLVF